MEFPSPPLMKERVSVPEGVHVKMCLCGTPCRLLRSTETGYTYGRRYWMCANYEYDPPQHRFSSNRRRSPPPLCEFIEYLDLEQSPEDIAEVERRIQEARARWRAMEEFDSFMERSDQALREEEEQRRKREAASKEREEEARKRAEDRQRREREEREAERERMRERARRARESGDAGLRKGKYPRCTQ